MSGRIITIALALSAATIGATLWLSRPAPEPQAQAKPIPSLPGDARSQQASTTNQRLSQAAPSALPDPGPLPPSLQGASHGVSLRMAADGSLLLQEDLLHLFDFYLAGLEEEELDKVLSRIHRDLAAQLQEPALTQARDLLRRYVDYRIALQQLPEADNLDAAALRQRLDALNAMRRGYFSAAEYSAFFARDNAEDEYMVQRLTLAGQSGLSEAQQAQALAELELQLPEEVRAARTESARHGELYAATQQLQQQGASSEEIRQLRERTLGTEAANALAELDRQQAAWKQRLADYASERNRLRAAGLSETDLQAAIAELQASRFDELERLRVQALDAEL